jgi:hypothetical protein
MLSGPVPSNPFVTSRPVPVAAFLSSALGLFLVTFGAALAVLVYVYWANFPDPFVRHDDFPTVLGLPDLYYEKTLNEGRWLNYWFIAKPFTIPTPIAMALYVVAWAIFAASFAVHAFGPRVSVFPGARLLLAALIALTPQMFEISQWFNTVLPGAWILAVFGLVCLFAPRRVAVLSMLVFVPLGFSAYNTYPFYMLALLMCRVDHERSFRDLALTLAIFVLAFAIGMYGTYAINWYMHGVFGIELGEWRQPNYARSLMSLMENSEVLARFVALLLYVYGFNYKWLGYLMFMMSMLAVLVIFRRNRLLTLYVCTPAALGLGLLGAYALMTGINVPVRATAFHWFIAAFSLVFAVHSLGRNIIARAGMVATLALLCGYWAQKEARIFSSLQVWQVATRDLAAQVPAESERIVVFGHMAMIDGAVLAGIQSFDGLSYRLTYLTGKPTVICRDKDADCSAEMPPFDPAPRFGSTEIGHAGGVTYIRLPAIDRVP